MEKIIFDEVLFAIIVRENFHRDGVFFFTDGAASLEMGYMSHPAGHIIKPHKHLPCLRQTLNTQEVLFLKSQIHALNVQQSRDKKIKSWLKKQDPTL